MATIYQTSAMFDSIEIIRDHQHTCCICGGNFPCHYATCDGPHESDWAVCLQPACIAEFEKPARQEWDEDGGGL